MKSQVGQARRIAPVVALVVLVSASAAGYYYFAYLPSHAPSSPTGVAGAVVIDITVGATTKTTDAYAPNPVTLVIGVNNTVVFYNGDLSGGIGVTHTATDRGGAFDTGLIQPGDSSKPITIAAPGTYNYYCVVHPTTMRGTIIVLPGTNSSSTSASESTG